MSKKQKTIETNIENRDQDQDKNNHPKSIKEKKQSKSNK